MPCPPYFSKTVELLKQAFAKHWPTALMILTVFANIAYMHYVCAPREYVGKWVIPVEFMFFDVSLLLLITGALSLWRTRIAYTAAFIISLLWSFANVIYFRYFNQYMPVSAFMETNNFAGVWWFEYVVNGLEPTDCLYLLTIAGFILGIKQKVKEACNAKLMMNWKLYLLVPVLVWFVYMATFSVKSRFNFKNFWGNNWGEHFCGTYAFDMERMVLYSGTFRSHVYCNIYNVLSGGVSLYSQEEKEEIEAYLKRLSNPEKQSFYGNSIKGKNIVLIIVESYLSVSSDLVIDGKEITPNLNKLRHTDGNYFNGNMRSNIEHGESSDGQFISLTGLLPLRNELTVVKILKNKIPAIPAVLRDSCGYSTHITIPTRPSFWHQSDVNIVYGIDSLYSIYDINFSLDEDILRFAYNKEKLMKEPYFHIILTATMHGGYETLRKGVPNYNYIFSTDYSVQFRNYLNTCHYTDSVIGNYIEWHKTDSSLSNTVFIIVSDHEVRKEGLKADSTMANNYKLPIYIVNANIDTCMVDGDINQIDLYPTILDMANVDAAWRGLGHSLFDTRNYNNIIDDKMKRVSEYIIREDGIHKQ